VTNPLPATELEHNQEAEIHAQGLQSLIATLPHGWTKLVYLSTTGVYGHGDQKTVNEETRAAPTRIGPTMALRAEQWLAENLQTDRYNVLRLAGIYGPGRIPLAEKIRAGEPLAVPQHGHLNLIHVADIARVILQLFRVHTRRPMYVLSDGHPVQRGTFYRDLATLCGVSAPQFVDPDPSSNRSLRAGDKCVDPSRLVEELKYQFRYPNYLTGLANALSEL
jgi:nucleoside-diphosphate-sugar epimerase